MPETIDYKAPAQGLLVGNGRIEPVEPAAWAYDISGMRVVKRWFDRRKREPDGRRSSPLDDMTPRTWSSEWTTELLEVLNVVTLLADLHGAQSELLERLLAGPLVTVADLIVAEVLPVGDRPGVEQPPRPGPRLFD